MPSISRPIHAGRRLQFSERVLSIPRDSWHLNFAPLARIDERVRRSKVTTGMSPMCE